MTERVRTGGGPEVDRVLGIDFDINKPLHRKVELTNEQIQYLSKLGFSELRAEALDGKAEIVVVRNETNDTDEHFVLQYLILEEIKNYTEKVVVHHTKLPDITFETIDGRLIAIEVIASNTLKANIEAMEDKLNILRKYNDYFFVVSDPALKKYESFGEILTRTQIPVRLKSFFN